MKSIDFSKNGGFPLSQDILAFLQTSYTEAIQVLASLCGDKTIISGVVVTGTNVSDGWIVYGGQLIRFVGGNVAANVAITTTGTALNFKNGISNTVINENTASCALIGAFPFSELQPIESTINIQTALNNLIANVWRTGDLKEVTCTSLYITDNFDGTGLGTNERLGWAVCNGQNGTINKGGRVSVGLIYPEILVDPVDNVWDVVYNTINSIAGEKKHILNIGEIPAHNHDIEIYENGTGDTTPVEVSDSDNYTRHDGTTQTGSAGGGLSHENRQPFIVTLFIQKL